MENFFYKDDFYSELSDFVDALDLEEEINDMPDDKVWECNEGSLQRILSLSAEWISERIDDDRWPEEDETTSAKVSKALFVIDFEKVNAMMPKLYYPSRKKFIITKQDILDLIKKIDYGA